MFSVERGDDAAVLCQTLNCLTDAVDLDSEQLQLIPAAALKAEPHRVVPGNFSRSTRRLFDK